MVNKNRSGLVKVLLNKQESLLFLFFLLITVLLIFYPNGESYDYKILSIYALISGISLFGIFIKNDSLPYSVNKTFYIFHYFFFGLAPSIQFKKNVTFFGANDLSPEVYYELGLCLIVAQLIYFLTYYILIKERKFETLVLKFDFSNSSYEFYYYMIIGVLSSFLFLYLISENFTVLFAQPYQHWQKDNTKLGLIGYTLLLIVRGIPLISLLLYKLNNKNIFCFKDVILLFFVMLVAFPTSLPRATMVSYYLPILLVYIPFFSKKNNYVLSFLVLFFVMFPAFNFFRKFKISDVDLGLQLFETAHMDAFHNFAQLYSQKIITNGKQLLGSIFFFIQESHWPNRPVGSGHMLAEINGYNFTNISMPLWGEGYVNFGFFGVFIFCILIAILNSFLDTFYKLNRNSIGIICFLFFIGYEFYLLRGDLYSSCKKIFSFVSAIIFVKLCLELIKVISKKTKGVF